MKLPGCFMLFWIIPMMAMATILMTGMLAAGMVRFWPVFVLAGMIFIGYRTSQSKRPAPEAPWQPAAPAPSLRNTPANSRVTRIKRAIPSTEPIRATLINVVEEATALRAMSDRIAGYPFSHAGVAPSLHPDAFREKSDEAIAVALDLTERIQIILENTRGRPRSARAAAALTAQQVRMEHLRDALVYSRDAIEELILTRGEGPEGPERLAQGLHNLTDAIDESYRDPLDVAIERLPAAQQAVSY